MHLCLSVETCIILLQSCVVASREGHDNFVFPQLIAIVLFYYFSLYFFSCIDIIDIEDLIRTI